MVTVAEVKFRVSPVFSVFDVVNCADHKKFPVEAASHTEMCVTISPLVPAHDAHEGVFDKVIAPAEAALNVADGRVVTDETAVVPAVPGLLV